MAKLSRKQLKFVAEYLKDGNGAAAARRAGYSEKGAKVQAHHLLTKPNLRAQVDKLIEKALEKSTMTKERALKELEIVGLADMGQFSQLDADGVTFIPTAELPPHQSRAIQEVTQTETFSKLGERTVTISLKLHPKNQALQLWLKAQGHLKDQVEHSGDKENPVKVTFIIPENGRD